MFENASLMAYTKSSNIFRVKTNSETQINICTHFSIRTDRLMSNKQEVPFDGSYKPEDDDILYIDNFKIDNAILDAIRTPLSISSLQNSVIDIKFLFIGEKEETESTEIFKIAFQKFKQEQCISPTKFNMFLSKDTFIQEDRLGIIIGDAIDCYYSDNKLSFNSYFFARQIFKLNEYYRIATDKDIKKFLKTPSLCFENEEEFYNLSNTYIRQKIAQIQDSEILDKHTAEEIKTCAEPLSIQIDIHDNKLVIPNDREKIKAILGFLDEEAYLGPFSQATYLANSKRKIST